jgi:hypothetical protein
MVGGGVEVATGEGELAGAGCAVGTLTTGVGLGVGAVLIVGVGDADRVPDAVGVGLDGTPPPPPPPPLEGAGVVLDLGDVVGNGDDEALLDGVGPDEAPFVEEGEEAGVGDAEPELGVEPGTVTRIILVRLR